MKRLVKSAIWVIVALVTACGGDGDRLQRIANVVLEQPPTDVWGYVDAGGREFAIVGFGLFLQGSDVNSGIAIIDVTDPGNPSLVSKVTSVPGFDVKVWRNFVYTCDGSTAGRGGIVDVSNPSGPVVVGNFQSSHNITISETGFMYLSSQQAPFRIYDLNPDPVNPQLIWSGGTDGHDSVVIGDRWYAFGADKNTTIYDVSLQNRPEIIGSIDAPFISFHHSGWPSEDGRYLYICDELADLRSAPADITIWDISDLNDPAKVNDIADEGATAHNIYIIGDFAYVSYYSAGFRIFDVSNPSKPKLIESFDTATGEGPGFQGAFGVYPFAPSGNIYVTDTSTGLHIFSFKDSGLGTSGNPLSP